MSRSRDALAEVMARAGSGKRSTDHEAERGRAALARAMGHVTLGDTKTPLRKATSSPKPQAEPKKAPSPGTDRFRQAAARVAERKARPVGEGAPAEEPQKRTKKPKANVHSRLWNPKLLDLSPVPHALPHEQEIAIVAAYAAGTKSVTVAESYGVNSSTVTRLVRMYGIPRRPKGWGRSAHVDRNTRILELHRLGLSQKEIAGSVGGITPNRVGQIIAAAAESEGAT